jgi:hypothetical protein
VKCAAIRSTSLTRTTSTHLRMEGAIPPPREIQACRPLLLEQLERIDPEVVVLQSRVAVAPVEGELVLEGRPGPRHGSPSRRDAVSRDAPLLPSGSGISCALGPIAARPSYGASV